MPDRPQQRQQLAVSQRAVHAHRSAALRRAHPRRRHGARGQRPDHPRPAELPRPRSQLRSALAHEIEPRSSRLLPGKMSLQVGYVGTRGMRLPVFLDANLVGQTPHGIAHLQRLRTQQQPDHQQITVPVYLPTDRRIPRRCTQLSTPASAWPTPGTTRWPSPSGGPSRNGLELLANYTWARATDTGPGRRRQRHLLRWRTPSRSEQRARSRTVSSDIDVRNRFTLSFVYQPQIFEGQQVRSRHVLDDFQSSPAPRSPRRASRSSPA